VHCHNDIVFLTSNRYVPVSMGYPEPSRHCLPPLQVLNVYLQSIERRERIRSSTMVQFCLKDGDEGDIKTIKVNLPAGRGSLGPLLYGFGFIREDEMEAMQLESAAQGDLNANLDINMLQYFRDMVREKKKLRLVY